MKSGSAKKRPRSLMETIKPGNKYRKEMKEYTDLYCSQASNGCGEIFWCPKSEIKNYGNFKIACPNCSNEISGYDIKFIWKLPSQGLKGDPIEIEDPIEKGRREDVCMICFERPPDIMVLPCEDVAVCKQCSDGLKNTADKNTCVRCRRPITHVLD